MYTHKDMDIHTNTDTHTHTHTHTCMCTCTHTHTSIHWCSAPPPVTMATLQCRSTAAHGFFSLSLSLFSPSLPVSVCLSVSLSLLSLLPSLSLSPRYPLMCKDGGSQDRPAAERD